MDNSTSLQEDHKERKDNYFVWLFKQYMAGQYKTICFGSLPLGFNWLF